MTKAAPACQTILFAQATQHFFFNVAVTVKPKRWTCSQRQFCNKSAEIVLHFQNIY